MLATDFAHKYAEKIQHVMLHKGSVLQVPIYWTTIRDGGLNTH